VLAGIGFKLGIFPFHWWIPDVYEGAPTPTVALLSVGSKMVGVVALTRVLHTMFLPLAGWWGPLLGLLAILTLCYGNLSALTQTNIKRMLGYSSIGHAGYLTLGLATGTVHGIEAVSFYLLAYILSGLCVFTVIAVCTETQTSDELEEYDGLAQRSPFLAACMFIGLLSLAGVPPTAGFFGKLLVILAAIESRFILLALIGAINVAVSLYYYLGLVKRMYANTPKTTKKLTVPPLATITLSLLTAAILLVGIVQGPIVEHIAQATQSLY